MTSTTTRVLVGGVGALLLLTGCTGGGEEVDPSGSGGGASEETVLRVFAAEPLATPFEALEDVFAEQHPDVVLELVTGSSSELAEQVVQGAPADVFASGDPGDMEAVVDAGDAADPAALAGDGLEIAAVSSAVEPELARAWIDLALSAEGARALREAGLDPPA